MKKKRNLKKFQVHLFLRDATIACQYTYTWDFGADIRYYLLIFYLILAVMFATNFGFSFFLTEVIVFVDSYKQRPEFINRMNLKQISDLSKNVLTSAEEHENGSCNRSEMSDNH